LGFVKRQTYRVNKARTDGTVYWTEAEIEKLMAMKIKGIPVRKMAESFDRTILAIHAQISKLEREGAREVIAVKMRPCIRSRPYLALKAQVIASAIRAVNILPRWTGDV
jgi:hypothetical protein